MQSTAFFQFYQNAFFSMYKNLKMEWKFKELGVNVSLYVKNGILVLNFDVKARSEYGSNW